MPALNKPAALADFAAGTTLIILGIAGALVRLGLLDFSQRPQWVAFEHWWPLLLVIVGLLTWLADMEALEPHHSRSGLEMPYGK